MKKITFTLISSLLLFSAVACNNAKTASDAPNTPEQSSQAPAETAKPTETAKQDASSDIRKKQMESDIRAREQRNQVAGNPEERADGDLESEVRTKLEANIPDGKLTVDAKEGAVTVGGTVSNQSQLNKIEPLAKEIKGVKSVAVKATVVAAKR